MTLKRKTVKNFGIVGGSKMFARMLSAITMVILARILLPSDFGIIAIATVFISLLDQFSNFGIGTAIIQSNRDTERVLSTGFVIRLSVSLFLFIVAFIGAPFWASFYEDNSLTSVVRAISFILILDAFKFFPETGLVKRLDFKLVAVAEIIGKISYSFVAIVLALSGFSYWSIVYGRIVQSIIEPVVLMIYSPWKLSLSFDTKIAKELVNFGKYVFFAGILTMIALSLDTAVIGKVIGMSALGYYVIALRWATITTSELYTISSRVMFPTYSSINTDLIKVRNAYLKTLKYISMVSVPAVFGIFILAPEFVITVLGEKWAPAILPLRILCINSLFGALSGGSGSVYISIGKPKFPLYLNLINLSILVIFIVPAAKIYGIVGVAILAASIRTVIFPINFSIMAKSLSIRKKQFMDVLFPPIFSSVLMVLLTWILKTIIKTNFSTVLTFSVVYLFSLVMFAVVVYFISLFIFTKGELKEDLLTLLSNRLPNR